MTNSKPTTRSRARAEPTLQQYRDWYLEQQKVAHDLRHELAMAKATISAMAYTLAYRAPRRDDDIPF